MKENWLKELENKLSRHHEPMRADAWDNLQKKLFTTESPVDASEPTQTRFQQKKNKMAIWQIAAAAIVLMSIGTALLWLYPQGDENSLHKNTIAHLSVQKEKNSINRTLKNTAEDPVLTSAHGNTPVISRIKQPLNLLKKIAEGKKATLILEKDPAATELSLKNPFQIDAMQLDLPEQSAILTPLLISETKQEQYASMDHKKESQSSRWTARVYAGDYFSQSETGQVGYNQAFASQLSAKNEPVNDVNTQRTTLLQAVSEQQNQPMITSERLSKPVSTGVTVFYQVGKKINVGIGLSYQQIRSEIRLGEAQNYIGTDQKREYLGLPVQVNYTLYTRKIFQTYAALGATLQKNIANQSHTHYMMNEVKQWNIENQTSKNTVQISSDAAIGFQLKLLPQISLFTEPGIQIGLKNNAALPNAELNKPVYFKMRFGVRIQAK